MATVFESHRLFISKCDVTLDEEMLKDLAAYGSVITSIDDDLAVLIYEHIDDYVFSTVAVELDGAPLDFSNKVHAHFKLDEKVSGTLIIEPLVG